MKNMTAEIESKEPMLVLPPALTTSTRSFIRITEIERGMHPTPNSCVLS